MYIVERAIILAAGIGERMRPVTNVVPKPLVKVNGTRMIETIIMALHENDIFEIYIVVGYMKEKFDCLLEKYPDICFIDNPYYDKCNNIGSLYVAREHLSNCLIMDGDLIINNSIILRRYFNRSGYNVIWVNNKTDEWLLNVKDGIITSCSRDGGTQGWQLYSISRWNEEDGKRLKFFLEVEFEKKCNHQIYWDDIALFCYPEFFKLSICEMNNGDVIEIDEYNELKKIDSSYENMEVLLNENKI